MSNLLFVGLREKDRITRSILSLACRPQGEGAKFGHRESPLRMAECSNLLFDGGYEGVTGMSVFDPAQPSVVSH
jgi:hypothetical protein